MSQLFSAQSQSAAMSSKMEATGTLNDNAVPDSDSSTSSDHLHEVVTDQKGGKTKYVVAMVVVLIVLIAVIVGSVCGTGQCGTSSSSKSATQDVPIEELQTLAQIRENGSLRCGVMKGIFQSTIAEGFNADLCRAISAACLGLNANVEFVEVTASDRFPMLESGQVDVLVADTSLTMERDIKEPTTGAGFSFSVPYLYTGLAFAGVPHFVDCADALESTGNCTGIRICTLQDATYGPLLEELYPGANLIMSDNVASSFNDFRQQVCQVIAGEQFMIAPSVIEELEIETEYKLGENLFSKEPLAIATRDGDQEWSDFVNWVLQGLIYAQEIGVTQRTAQLLGTTEVFGPELPNVFVDAVSSVGNYGEIYVRHLNSSVPQALGPNDINTGDSGLIYSMPFGNIDVMGPAPSGTLAAIRARGELRCGISNRPIFAVEDPVTKELSGQDVDFCRALSAAIFDGQANNVRYTDLSAAQRFNALADGDVDVLSRITTVTLARDVLEPSAETGFSFSQPNFYDGLSFGGRPPFGSCADNLDTTSEGCRGLRICVNDGTTFLARMQDLFPPENIVVKERRSLVLEGLKDGDCNAIAGGIIDVSMTSVTGDGEFVGPYEIGSRLFTKDPLALVTRQDDEQWSSFVYWVVSAIFFAEELELGRLNSIELPLVNLFGPAYRPMFRNVIGAVGNFGEIYDRNVASEVPRSSLNQLNENPFGPQHYAYPGI